MTDASSERTHVAEIISARLGISVRSVWDLARLRTLVPGSVPVPIEILPQVSDPATREGIVRALRTPEAAGLATDALLQELGRTRGEYYRWVIAYTMTKVAVARDSPSLLLWLSQEPDPATRSVLAQALGQARNPEAVPALVDLLTERIPAGRAARALARIGVNLGPVGLQRLRDLKQSGNTTERAAADAAIARLAGSRRPLE
jgi:HEAT repeat protein